MYAEKFEYHRATSVDDCIEVLAASADARVLAGGQGLIPLMKQREIRPGTVVDISSIDSLTGIEATSDEVRIGALTTHSDVISSSTLNKSVPVIPKAASQITGGPQVHNFATIGGNLARGHPGYDHEAALVAADSEIVVQGPDGTRSFPASEFVVGACSTVLESDEIITEIRAPKTERVVAGGYAKRKEPASGGAIVGVATALTFQTEQAEEITAARVAVNGLQETAIRLEPVENAVVQSNGAEDMVRDAVTQVANSLDPATVLDDGRASAEYRRSLLQTQTVRSVRQTLEKRTGDRDTQSE